MAGARVVSITRVADGEYVVAFATPEGLRREYGFTVSGADILVVTWDEDFAAVVGPDPRPARAVYAALQAMHAAFTATIDLDLDPTSR